MIIFKTVLTEKQIEEYVRPEGTKNPACGGGVNCAFCTLKLLGVYTSELEEKSKTCGPRARAGNFVKTEEYITAVKQVIADMTEEHHDFVFVQEIGQPSVSLAKIAENLDPLEACYFIYGRSGYGTHAVVLRKNAGGEVELIDPQRGSDDVGKEFGFTAARAAELGVELTPQYYRVRGIPAIEAAMVEQSVLFSYWETKEELMADLPHFVVACLMVDSVVGLKMLVDDRDTSKLMEVEETAVPNPQMDVEETSPSSSPPMDVEVEMEGGARTGTAATHWDEYQTTLKVEKDTKLAADILRKGLSMAAPTPAVDPELYTTILNLLGTVEGDNVITHLYKIPEEEEDIIAQEGGASTMISAEEYKNKIKELWSTRTDDYVNDTFKLFKKSLEFYNVGRTRDTTAGRQEGYEVPPTSGPRNQCEVMDISGTTKNICWLCDGFAGYKWQNQTQMGICKLLANRPECEHVLPAPLMYFLKTLVNNKGGAPTTDFQKRLQKKLYDNSCHLCNWKKWETLYIHTREPNGDIEPHIPNILTDVIIFFMVYMESPTCGSDGGNMGTIPAGLGGIGSLVHVKGTYFPNPIRAQLNAGFNSGRGGGAPTRQAEAAAVATKFTDPLKLLEEVKKSHDKAYDKLRFEPDIHNIYETIGKVKNLDSVNSLPHIEVAFRGEWIPAENLSGDLRNIAKVNKNVAVDWVLRRFCGIYERMEEICDLLNSPDGKALWKQQLDTVLKTLGEPMNSVKKIAIKNNGDESERLRADRRREPVPPPAAPEDPARPPPPPPAPGIKRRREDDTQSSDEPAAVRPRIERENSGQSQAIDDRVILNVPSAQPGEGVNDDDNELLNFSQDSRLPPYVGGGHLDISVHRGGRRIIDVDL
uniref:Uncharacterized protein n=1 Tax=viral metagenome TaxID=1070528 RepID=A0A6C0CGK8_9ZZZZ